MNKLYGLLLAFLLGVVLTFAALSLTQSTWRLSSQASLKAVGVEVYLDQALTEPALSVDWGILEPGQTKNVSIYVVNRSNVAITLTMATQNWQPANASNYMTFVWDCAGQPLSINESLQVVLSLQIHSDISGIASFSFGIIIIGSG
jgi:hypothetical protein